MTWIEPFAVQEIRERAERAEVRAEAAESLLRKAARVAADVTALYDYLAAEKCQEATDDNADARHILFELRAALNALTPEDREALKGWAK